MDKSEPTGSTPKKLLFLCTGNYYRSRFAATLFNALALRTGLDWWADSRGTAPELGTGNVGPISLHALRGLQARGISMNGPHRFPLRVEEQDVAEADLVIAVKEPEHRPAIEERFLPWSHKVSYWHIDDLDVAPPEVALAAIKTEVENLIQHLSRNGSELYPLPPSSEDRFPKPTPLRPPQRGAAAPSKPLGTVSAIRQVVGCRCRSLHQPLKSRASAARSPSRPTTCPRPAPLPGKEARRRDTKCRRPA